MLKVLPFVKCNSVGRQWRINLTNTHRYHLDWRFRWGGGCCERRCRRGGRRSWWMRPGGGRRCPCSRGCWWRWSRWCRPGRRSPRNGLTTTKTHQFDCGQKKINGDHWYIQIESPTIIQEHPVGGVAEPATTRQTNDKSSKSEQTIGDNICIEILGGGEGKGGEGEEGGNGRT